MQNVCRSARGDLHLKRQASPFRQVSSTFAAPASLSFRAPREGAERRDGAGAERRTVGRAMTRHAGRLARHPAPSDVGRAPLGALPRHLSNPASRELNPRLCLESSLPARSRSRRAVAGSARARTVRSRTSGRRIPLRRSGLTFRKAPSASGTTILYTRCNSAPSTNVRISTGLLKRQSAWTDGIPAASGMSRARALGWDDGLKEASLRALTRIADGALRTAGASA